MNLKIIEPLGYLEMIYLLINAKLVITDSGGLTKESFWSSVPCITLMDFTTWPETVDLGWNILAGLNTKKDKILFQNLLKTRQILYLN